MKLLIAIFTLLVCLTPAIAQQQADPEFDTSVAKPAYKKDGPRVMFDEAHHNFHTTDGRYKPFVDLLMNDGYNVIRNRQPFAKTRLSGFKILVIANALGAEEDDDKGADESAFTTEEIAAAFLTPAPTIAQRIVRAKSKIRDANIPYQVPARDELPERLESVLRVVYLVFNEGYSASSGDSATRADLSGEAIRLGRLIVELIPEPEARGLLALMLLHESRRETRATPDGELVLLDEQDRSRWNRAFITEGAALVRTAFESQRLGPYAIQAAIAAVHAEAPTAADTDWREIVGLYDLLLRISPSPVVALNRAVALAMRDGPEAGLAALDELLGEGVLDGYQLAHAARADFCRRLGRHAEAREAYQRAIKLTAQTPARRFLEKRLAALPD